jgi:hypothetical protein
MSNTKGSKKQQISFSSKSKIEEIVSDTDSLKKKSKIGTFSGAEFQNWLNTPIQKPKVKRTKKSKDDTYQIFQDLSEMVSDVHWKAFFTKLAIGKFPHGYSYRNQTIFFRKRTKIEKIEVQDSSYDTLNRLMNFFQNYGGFTSSDDNINIFEYLVSQSENYQQWKDIRSKKTKQFFIQQYVEEISEKKNLNAFQKRCLSDTIHMGFLLRIIDSTDIDFEDRKIKLIKTLFWNEEKNEYELKGEAKPMRISRKTINEKGMKNSFSAHWNRFLTHITKDKSNIPEDLSTDVSTLLDTTDLTDTTLTLTSE